MHAALAGARRLAGWVRGGEGCRLQAAGWVRTGYRLQAGCVGAAGCRLDARADGLGAGRQVGMHVNRYHWAISHYIGSQLRQCVLDPDGGTIYGHDHPRRLPTWFPARRLYPKPCTEGDATQTNRTEPRSQEPTHNG